MCSTSGVLFGGRVSLEVQIQVEVINVEAECSDWGSYCTGHFDREIDVHMVKVMWLEWYISRSRKARACGWHSKLNEAEVTFPQDLERSHPVLAH